jgi:hypothetical protein
MLKAREILLPCIAVNLIMQFACSESGANKAANIQFDFNQSSTGLPVLSTDQDKLDLILSSVFSLQSKLQDADKDEIKGKLAEMREATKDNKEFTKQLLKTYSPEDIELIHETLEEEGLQSGDSNSFKLLVNTDLIFAEIGADLSKKSGLSEGGLEPGAWTVEFPQGGFIDILVEDGVVINSKAPCMSGSCGTTFKSVRMEKVPIKQSPRSQQPPSNPSENDIVNGIIASLNQEGHFGIIGFWELCMVEDLKQNYPTNCKKYHGRVIKRIGDLKEKLDQNRHVKEANRLIDVCYVDLPSSTRLLDYEYCKEAADAGLAAIKVKIDELDSKKL